MNYKVLNMRKDNFALGTFFAIWSIAFFIALAPFDQALAESKRFEGKGEAPIKGYDFRATRALAIKRAARAALEEATGSLLNPRVFHKKYNLLDSEIFSKRKRFVGRTTPLSEFRKGNRYFVVVWAYIDVSLLKTKLVNLGLIPPPESMPRWMVIIPNRVNDGPRSSGWMEGAGAASIPEAQFGKIIVRYGYRVAGARGEGSVAAEAVENPADNLAKILETAKRINATHLLVGESAVYSNRGIVHKEYTLTTARISVMAFEVATGKVVGETSTSIALEIPDGAAIEKATIPAVCRKLRDELTGWLDMVNPSGAAGFERVSLLLRGFINYAHYDGVITALDQDIKGVRKVHLKSLARGEALVEVRFAGGGVDLVNQLRERRFKGFSLEPDGEEDGKFILKFIPHGKQT